MGEIIAERYEIKRELGRGAMGAVYLCRDLIDNADVAVKKIEVASFEASRREFEILKSVSHPNISRAIDYIEFPEENFAYIVQEYVEGKNFFEATRGADLKKIAALSSQVAIALHFLNKKGIVHGDIKPANIIVNASGVPKLLDFGLASLSSAKKIASGTLAYMAPEVVLQGGNSFLSEIFSLGAVIHEAICGATPYGDAGADTIAKIISENRPLSIAHKRPDIPAGLIRIVDSAISINPTMRYQSAGNLARDLAAFAGITINAKDWRGGKFTFTGRERELAEIVDRINAAAIGKKNGAYIIHGAKGVGASRLLEAALDSAKLSGGNVVYLDAESGVDPLGALISIFKPEGGTRGAESKLGDEDSTGSPTRIKTADAIAEAASKKPILIAFDNLESAGETVIDLFRFLALEFSKIRPRERSALILGAFSETLTANLAEDVEAGFLENMELAPLGLDATEKLALEAWGEKPSDEAAKKLFEISGGNPFWLGEIFNEISNESALADFKIPDSVSGLLRSKISRIDSGKIRLIEALAIFGAPARADELAELSQVAAAAAIKDLSELVVGGLVIFRSGKYLPANSLVCDIVKTDTTASRLKELSSKSADIILRGNNFDAALVARLLIDAKRADEATPYAIKAGENFSEIGAYRDAALLYERLLEEAALDNAAKRNILEAIAKAAAPSGLWKIALKSLRERLEIASDDSPETRAEFHLEMAHCQQRIGEYERALRAIDRADDELKNRSGVAQKIRAAELRSLINIALGKYNSALEIAETAIAAHKNTGALAAPVSTAAGIALIYLGQHSRAVEYLNDSVSSLLQAGKHSALIMSYSGLGMARQHAQNPDEALESYNLALDAARKSGDARAESTVVMNIATIYQSKNLWEDARRNYQRALILARQSGAQSDEIRIGGNLANLLLFLGDFESAMPMIEMSLRNAERAGLEASKAYATLLKADAKKSAGLVIEAHALYLEAKSFFRKLGSAREATQTNLRLARLYIEIGENRKAAETISEAIAEARSLGYKGFIAEGALLNSILCVETGRSVEAEIYAKEAMELSGGDAAEISWETFAALGAAMLAKGNEVEAAKNLQTAYAKAIELRDSIPEQYRDAFLGGRLWKNLLKNIDVVKREKKGIPVERWQKLIEISGKLTFERNLEKLLETIMDSVLELIEAERGFIILIENDNIVIPVARNIDRESIRGAKMKISRSIAENVARSGEPIITVDAQHDSRFDAFESVRDLKLRSILCMPLKIMDKAIGTLYVDNRFREGAFGEEELKLMEAFANQSAIAIDNARKNEDLERSHKRIESLVEELEKRVDTQNEQIEVMRAKLERRSIDAASTRFPAIIGSSALMSRVLSMIERVSAIDAPVLIEGESGTGKELVAKAIHFDGPRKNKMFLSENCSAIPETLLESELFGYEKGAFTGATDRKIGLFEMADNGTLFLDEIGDMSPGMQSKLLRVLQEGEVRRVGGEKTFKVNVRIISATHQTLDDMVKRGKFREDLFYRLNVVKIEIPPLRQRQEDVIVLVKHFSKLFEKEIGRPIEVDAGALKFLVSYDWPGNVRELENEIRKAAAMGDGKITIAELSEKIVGEADARRFKPASMISGTKNFKTATEEFEKAYLRKVLKECGGNRAEAARKLGIGRRTLYDKLEKLGIDKEE